MRGLPQAATPRALPLVLASGSPRRSELMTAAGYAFTVWAPSDSAEDQPRPGEPADQVVMRLAYQKAADVVSQLDNALVIGADTLGVCDDQLLGKPVDAADARRMLQLLSGRRHRVLTGICLWDVAAKRVLTEAVCTEIEMMPLDAAAIEDHIDSHHWRGKAGGFGFQDGNDWLRIIDGSESNVVGLPMERLAELLTQFDKFSGPVR